METEAETPAIDRDVVEAAQRAARRDGASLLIGWWQDGTARTLMLLPEGHGVTAEQPFRALLRVTPAGRTERLDGGAITA